MLIMNSTEQIKLDVIGKLSQGQISTKQAMQILDKSESTIFRYLRKFRLIGALFVKHKNSNKIPINKTMPELEEKIIKLCQDKYKNFNRSHAREEIKATEGISIAKDTFNRICKRNNILTKQVKKRKCKSKYRRDRMKQTGIMLQLDGSPHRWFGRRKTCLVLIIDDATSDPLYGEFSPTETTFACMNVIKQVLRSHGAFQILYTDRAGIFGRNTTNHFDGVKREGFSSLKRCILKFGIHTIYAQSAEAKGRIERAFNTLQDRLVAEFELNKIKTIAQANKYLNEVYLPKHRKNFSVDPANQTSGFTPILSSVNLDDYFYMSLERKIKNDHTFSLEGIVYDIEKAQEDQRGKTIEIRKYPDGKTLYFIDDKEVRLRDKLSQAIG